MYSYCGLHADEAEVATSREACKLEGVFEKILQGLGVCHIDRRVSLENRHACYADICRQGSGSSPGASSFRCFIYSSQRPAMV